MVRVPRSGDEGFLFGSRVWRGLWLEKGSSSAPAKRHPLTRLPVAASRAYLLGSAHAIPGFVFQEILFSKITFAAFGTFKWLFSSVFPRGNTNGEHSSPPVRQQRRTNRPGEDTGKELGRGREGPGSFYRPPQRQY